MNLPQEASLRCSAGSYYCTASARCAAAVVLSANATLHFLLREPLSLGKKLRQSAEHTPLVQHRIKQTQDLYGEFERLGCIPSIWACLRCAARLVWAMPTRLSLTVPPSSASISPSVLPFGTLLTAAHDQAGHLKKQACLRGSLIKFKDWHARRALDILGQAAYHWGPSPAF